MKRSVLVTATTRVELYFLAAVVRLLKAKDPNIAADLLIRRSMLASLTPEIRSLFSQVHALRFPREKYLLEGLLVGIMFTFSIRRFVNQYDLILINSFRELFANIICRAVKDKTKLIALCSADPRTSEDFHIKRFWLSYRTIILSWLLGYSVIKMRWCGDSPLVFSKDYVQSPFSKILFIDEAPEEHISREGLIAVPPPFFALTGLHEGLPKTIQEPAILIAGERIPLYPSWSAKDEEIYQGFLTYLRESFPNHNFYFRPRPGLTDVQAANVGDMILHDDPRPLEVIYMTERIDKVISMKSTASVMASFFGHQGYHLFHMFDCPKDFLDATDHLYSRIRSVICMEEYSDIHRTNPLNKNIEEVGSIYYNAIFSDDQLMEQ